MTIPNYITLLRILLVPFIYTTLAYYDQEHDHWRLIALTLFSFASFTDALDGFICRRWNMRSVFGTFLDPLADKLLLISTFIAINASSLIMKPPFWVITIIVFRDIFILSGLVIIFISSHKVQIRPNMLGKATTLFQMITVITILLQTSVAPYFWHLTACLTVTSGIVYILRDIRRLHEIKT